AGDGAESRRDLVPDWLDRLAAAGLPLASRGGERARTALALGAPLPVGMAAERELADLLLADRLPAWRVREAVAAALPDGCELVEVDDVWLGAPPLAGSIAGADYRVTLGPDADPGVEVVRGAGESLLAEQSVLRVRQKGGRDVAYDLRPLVAAIEVLPGHPTVLKIRVRFDPERGSGRPDEVLAALGERLGQAIVAAETVRERLLLAEDLADATANGNSR
ncbi:MAG: TIGR03936 family radical SAM-associated protein, partial [Chloroflexota bacterium]|nr:TIGR03936 family radical SAM-associated protein [Chloroflexota bacterium]